MEKDIVIFRRWKAGKKRGEVFALFPLIAGELKGSCVSYNKDLKESEIIYKYAMNRSIKTALLKDTKTLKYRLEKEGFKLDIRERVPGSGRTPIYDEFREDKFCPVCEKHKIRLDFPRSNRSRDLLHSTCIECSSIECSINEMRKKSKEERATLKTELEKKLARLALVRKGRYTTRQIAKSEQGTLTLY